MRTRSGRDHSASASASVATAAATATKAPTPSSATRNNHSAISKGDAKQAASKLAKSASGWRMRVGGCVLAVTLSILCGCTLATITHPSAALETVERLRTFAMDRYYSYARSGGSATVMMHVWGDDL